MKKITIKMAIFAFVIGCLAGLGMTQAHADVIAATTDELNFLSEADLAVSNLSVSITNLRAVAVGDVITTSPGLEIVVAHGVPSVLEVRAADGTTILASRDFGADLDPIGHPGGGPTYNGPETINDLAIGECRSDLPGLEISVASQAILGANTTGVFRVLNYSYSNDLGECNGLGTYFNCSATAIADVNSRNSGGEVIFCFQYQPNGSSWNSQIATYQVTSAGFVGGAIRNVAGFIPAAGLMLGDASGDGGNPEILVGTDLGLVQLCQAAIQDPGNPALLSFAFPTSYRADLTNVKAVAFGDVSPAGLGQEVIVCASDGVMTTLRVIASNSGGLAGELANLPAPSANVFAMVSYNALNGHSGSELLVATQDDSGSLLVLDGALSEIKGRTGLGVWSDLAFIPPVFPTGVPTTTWALY